MSNFLEFSSDRVNIFSLVIDESSSMTNFTNDMIEAIREYKESFRDFSEVNSISAAINRFNDDFYEDSFKRITDIEFRYRPDSTTALYYAIVKASQKLLEYVEEVITKYGVNPRATFIVFSDGDPVHDRATSTEAKRAIKELNDAGIDTVFVAFGDKITAEFGKGLGFVSTRDVNEKDTLRKFIGEELSQSCKEQSKSLKSLGSNFFSQANKPSTKNEYSNKATEVINDKGWFDDIFAGL